MAITSVQIPNSPRHLSRSTIEVVANVASYAAFANYHLICDVQVQETFGSGIYASRARLQGRPDSGGVVRWRIERFVAGLTEYGAPDYAAGNSYVNNSPQGIFRVVIEEWGDNTQQSTVTGIGQRVVEGWLESGSTQSLNDYIGTGRFLTRMPAEVEVSRNQPLWLSWMANGAYSTLDLVVEAAEADGTAVAVNTTTWQRSNVGQGDLTVWDVSYRALGLMAAASDATVWAVWLESDGTRVSEKKTFRLPCLFHSQERFYIFQNGLGGWDTVRSVGELRAEGQVAAEQAERLSGFRQVRAGLQSLDSYEQTTGLHSPVELRWLADLQANYRAWRVGSGLRPAAGAELIEINLDGWQGQLLDDSEDLPEFRFSYTKKRLRP